MKIYHIYTQRNLADTMRDPDDIVTEQLSYCQSLDQAFKVAKDYIKNRFFHKNTKLTKSGTGYVASDFCSYGATLYIKEIEVI